MLQSLLKKLEISYRSGYYAHYDYLASNRKGRAWRSESDVVSIF